MHQKSNIPIRHFIISPHPIRTENIEKWKMDKSSYQSLQTTFFIIDQSYFVFAVE